MPVGIENLATGFLQGLNAKKQQERQDVIDQREAERFDMQKAQFADNQAANQLSMKTNQFQLGQAQAEAERDRILQEKEDNFRKQWEGFARPFAMGNDQEGYNALERTFNNIGYMGKGAFKRDDQGNVLLDDKGNITFLTYGADGKPTSKSLNKDQMIEGFINSYDPLKHWEYERKTAAEIAKEERDYKREVAKLGIQHQNAVSLEGLRASNRFKELDKQNQYKNKEDTKELSKDVLSLFETVETTTDKFGQIKQAKVIDKNALNNFVLWADENNQPANATGYKKWLRATLGKPTGLTINQPSGANGLNAAQPQNSPVDLLRGKNIITEQDAADAIRELRAKKFTDEQINAAFDELGL